MNIHKTNSITAAVFFFTVFLHFFVIAVAFLHVSRIQPPMVQTQFVMHSIPKPVIPAAPPRSSPPKKPMQPQPTQKPATKPLPKPVVPTPKPPVEAQPIRQEAAAVSETQTEATEQTGAAQEMGSADEAAYDSGNSGESITVDFKQMILQRIAEKKIYPKAARKRNQEGSVTIAIVVLKSGQLADVHITSPCSYKFLNEAALASVRSAAPFPLDDTAPEKIELTVTLEYRLEG
ncbi:MAG: energy transducer TonB [Treponema sp.]